jgi:photosystem II stability/assembly factor-like uncharacterized protein
MEIKYSKQLVTILVVFFGCQTSDDTFLDYYKIYTSLPPASSAIASPYKHQEFHAYINERYEIYGTGNGKRFYSTDLLETIEMKTGFGKFGDYNADGKNVLTSYEDDDDFVIAASANYGFDFTPKVSIPNIDYDYVAVFYLNPDMGWVISPSGYNAHIYEIKGNKYTKIATVNASMYADAISVYFKNDLEGYLLLGDTFGVKTKLFKTSDGGKSWGSPSVFDLTKDSGNTPYEVKMIKAFGNLVVAYPVEEGRSGYHKYLYLSRDGGSSWEFIHNNKACYQFLDEQTGYALEMSRYVYNWEDNLPASTSYLQKTTDSGRTWQRVSNQVLYADNIFFINENVGIATSYSMMQVTVDGGTTWHLLVYPLEEGT